MTKLDTSQLQKLISSKQLTEELAFEACWQNFLTYCEKQHSTINSNIINSYENICKGFKRYLISQNHALIESQITSTLTELEREKFELQDSEYGRLCTKINSMIYIVSVSGKNQTLRVEKTASQILFITLLQEKAENPDFEHFINIFKNCVTYTQEKSYSNGEYSIPQKIFESFCTLFPEFIRKLQEDSFAIYAKLQNEKAPYDEKIKEIEMKIRQKLKEIIEDRVSYIILPTGKRLNVVYDDN